MNIMLTPPSALEALLFASGEPVEKTRLAELLEVSEEQFSVVLKALDTALAERGLALIETDTEVELRTTAEAAPIVKKLRESEFARDLGKGSLETLAVIAYHEGASRSEIDWVRGVNSSASLRTLLLRGLIEGREDEGDKRRIRYTLTTEALAHLGITHPDDLPRAEELRTGTHTIIAEETSLTENPSA
jgi:segregation and condensation protein B